jgi:hypothetical protein
MTQPMPHLQKTAARWAHWAALLLLVWVSGWAMAQDKNADADTHIRYTLKPGDMLFALAQQYLQNPSDLETVARINRIGNIHRVPVGKVILIPRELLKYVPATAQVSFLRCRNVLRLDGPQAQTITLGTTLTEGAVLRIPPGCQFSMTFEDNTTVRLLSGAVVKLTTLRRNVFDPSPEVKLDLLDGRIHLNVPNKRPPGDAPFQVTTPTSVAGIRGTQFRVGFVSRNQSSQVEVRTGAVAAKGQTERNAQLALDNQGVPISNSGIALPLEPLLPAPKFASLQTPGTTATLVFQAPPQAARYQLSTADDANFSFLLSDDQTDQTQVAVPDLSAKARFFQWSSISNTGLMGHTADYAICQGYQKVNAWRCNVPFNFDGYINPHLLLQKIDANAPLTVMDAPIRRTEDNLLVFRGLPSGLYRWVLEYEFMPGKKAKQEGQFELIAIPKPDA